MSGASKADQPIRQNPRASVLRLLTVGLVMRSGGLRFELFGRHRFPVAEEFQERLRSRPFLFRAKAVTGPGKLPRRLPLKVAPNVRLPGFQAYTPRLSRLFCAPGTKAAMVAVLKTTTKENRYGYQETNSNQVL
jgi:hypothetical protein